MRGSKATEAISKEIAASALRFSRNDVRDAKPLLKVVGNIPYYITSPILLYLIRFREVVDSAYLTIQREVADRIFAQPATKSYGRLTLLVRFYAEVERAFEIFRNCFSPKPNVDSTVIRLEFRRSLPDSINEQILFDLIKAGFAERRKNILNAMSNGFDRKFTKDQIQRFLVSARIDPKSRAETLMLKDFICLTEVMSLVSDTEERCPTPGHYAR